MKELNNKIEISDEAFQLLLDIEKNKIAEYRDTEYSSLEDFLENRDEDNPTQTAEWFLKRNFNGTYHLLYELIEHDLVEDYTGSWHITYRVSIIGSKMIEANK